MLLQKDKVSPKLLILVAAVICVITVVFFVKKPGSRTPEINPADLYSLSRDLKINLVLQNSTSRLLENSETRLFIPHLQNAHQFAEFVSANKEFKIFQDNIGNQQAYLRLTKVEPGQSIPIIMDLKLYQSKKPVQTDEPDIVQYLYIDNIGRESLDKLYELTKKFKAPDTNETVNNVLQWWGTNKNNLASLQDSESQTEENMPQELEEVSGRPVGEEPVKAVIDEAREEEAVDENDEQFGDVSAGQKQGDTIPAASASLSTTFHDALIGNFQSLFAATSLVTAMLRSVEIPARTVIGINVSDKNVATTQDLLFWIEYFDGSVWKVVDLINSQIAQNPQAYLAIKMFRELPTEFTEEKEVDFLYESAGLSVAPGSIRILLN